MKRVFNWLFLLTASLIIALVVGEVALRIWDKANGVTPPYTHNLPECLAVPSGYFNYDLERNVSVVYDSKDPRKFSLNEFGFRAPDYDPIKPYRVKRIFCVGGSSTFDPYVSDEESWCHLLGRKISEATGDSIECINAGRYGYTTSEIVGLVYHRILRHDPDLIILYASFNDARRLLSPYRGAEDSPQLYGNPKLAKLNKSSALVAIFDFRLRHVWQVQAYKWLLPNYSFEAPPSEEHEVFVSNKQRALEYNSELFSRNVSTIIDLARKQGVEVLLATQMTDLSQAHLNPIQTELVGLNTDQLRTIALLDSVSILDFSSFVKTGILQSYIHLNAEGCKVLSSKLSEQIMQDSLLN